MLGGALISWPCWLQWRPRLMAGLLTKMQVYGLMERGAEQRATGATKLNEMSSRSHAVRDGLGMHDS